MTTLPLFLLEHEVDYHTQTEGFESRVLKRIFGLKRGEIMAGWRKLHNEDLQNCTLRQT
jgi:hypothetical protein